MIHGFVYVLTAFHKYFSTALPKCILCLSLLCCQKTKFSLTVKGKITETVNRTEVAVGNKNINGGPKSF